MSIARLMEDMAAKGASLEVILMAVRAIEEEQNKASERRAKVAERKRRQRERDSHGTVTGLSEDSPADPSLSLPPNENNSNPPTHTHPDVYTPRAKAEPFAKPEWADPQHWTDLKANRKAKRLANTPTAHAKLLRDISKWTNDAWPPGRVLEAVVARGWAAAEHDPRGNQHGQPARLSGISPPASDRGARPDPCLDMLRAARAAQDTPGDLGADFPAWTSLPAIGSG